VGLVGLGVHRGGVSNVNWPHKRRGWAPEDQRCGQCSRWWSAPSVRQCRIAVGQVIGGGGVAAVGIRKGESRPRGGGGADGEEE
jgi:hypothetical protein